jgi:putative membrane protein
VIILASSLFGESFGFVHDFVAIVSITLIGIALLTLNRVIMNRLYLKEFNAQFEIESENIAFATLQAGGFISMAVIMMFSFYNFEFTVDLLAVALFYFFLTQFSLYFVSKLLFLVTPYDDVKELKRGNMAVALNFFGTLIALSLLFGNSVREVLIINFDTVALLLLYFTLSALLIIYIPTLITSLLISINKRVDEAIEEGNIAVATTEMMVKVGVAVVVISTIPLNIFIVS